MTGEPPPEVDVEQSVTTAVTDPLASQPEGVEVRVIWLEQSPDCAAAPRLTAHIIKATSRFIGLGLRTKKIRHNFFGSAQNNPPTVATNHTRAPGRDKKASPRAGLFVLGFITIFAACGCPKFP